MQALIGGFGFAEDADFTALVPCILRLETLEVNINALK